MQTTFKYRNLLHLFDQSVQSVSPADKLCLEVIRGERHETLTYAQLRERAAAFAHWLRRNTGLDMGDHVALVAKNRADWDVALWGIMHAGGVPVLIDPERGPDGVIGHLNCTDCKALVLADDYADESARAALAEHAGSNHMPLIMMSETGLPGSDGGTDSNLADVRGRLSPDDTAVILCTSGTTGDPREVELSHENLIANIQGSVEKVDIAPDDVLGHILPPHHSFGLTVGKFLPLAAGATNVYTNRYREVSDLIRDRKITIFIAIPALFTTLAKRLEEALTKHKERNPIVRQLDRHLPQMVGKKIRQRQGWTRLRFFLSGAAPMPRWVLDVLWRRGFLMYEGYGTTENSPVYGFNTRHDKLGSVGRPINTLTVKVVDEDNRTLPPGERGEICLGGPCIMKGYYKNPAATAAVIDIDKDGTRWLHTGDLGYLDDDGDLFITGRKKYLIILPGGKNVNPERVETVLSEARFVKEALVVPNRKHDANGIMEETMRALVQPAWETMEQHTGQAQQHLAEQPQLVKSLVWESIRDCQQKNKHLSSFERIAAHHLEIHAADFEKTSTGKIKRERYINLEHLEAKHAPAAEIVAAERSHRAMRDASVQPDGNGLQNRGTPL